MPDTPYFGPNVSLYSIRGTLSTNAAEILRIMYTKYASRMFSQVRDLKALTEDPMNLRLRKIDCAFDSDCGLILMRAYDAVALLSQ